MEEKIERNDLLCEVQCAIKDLFVAIIRKRDDELIISFPNGQKFTLAIWENSKK